MIDITPYKAMMQKSDEWYLARKGKITASETADIMVKSRKKDDVFGQTALSYLKSKAAEWFIPEDYDDDLGQSPWTAYCQQNELGGKALQWGNDWEPVARARYDEAFALHVQEVGFIPYHDFPQAELFAGGSPDGCMPELGGIIEIKCPMTMKKHIDHYLYEAPDDLKKGEPEYYWQCLMNILVTDASYCDFISFHPYVSSDKQLKVLRISANDNTVTADLQALRDRLILAVDALKAFIASISKAEPQSLV